MERSHRRSGNGGAGSGGETAGAPGKATLTGRIQRKASGTAASPGGMGPGEVFAAATAGAQGALPYRAEMERAFGHDFGGVSAHVGTPEAGEGMAALGAHAATVGETVAFAQPDPDRHLVAHELAHVVQQRRGGGGVQAKDATLGAPGDAAELAADRAADAIVRGEPVPDVGSADGATVRRAVNTNGGVFDNPTYQAYTPSTPSSVGFNAIINFTAGDLVEAPAGQIGLVQTVKGDTNRVGSTNTLNPTRDQPNTAVTSEPEEAGLVVPAGQTGGGRAVDIAVHRPGRTDANHNPLYGVGYGSADPSTDLTGGTPSLASTQRGDHVRNPNGTFQPATPAVLEDWPWRPIRVPGQTFEMTFEVAALVTGGPMANTYLGAVEWGWQSNAAGGVTGKPFRAVASGAPTAGFMGAAQVWNDATFHTTDGANTAVPTIDLPITSTRSGAQAAVDMTTRQLITQLPVVTRERDATTAGSVDRTNKDFEVRAIETELRARRVAVRVRCGALQDTGSAARPARDEVWLSATSTAGAVITGTHSFAAGAEHTYHFTVGDLWPFTDAITLDLMEHDRAGTTSAAADDTLATLTWAPPFAALAHQVKGNGTYDIDVNFER